MRCTGAAGGAFCQWRVNAGRPVILVVRRQEHLLTGDRVRRDNKKAALLERFVATFNRLDASTLTSDALPPAEFALNNGFDVEHYNFRPIPVVAPSDALTAIRRIGSLPELFELLALSYRWPSVDLRVIRLLPNMPADDLRPLAAAMFCDPVLNATLLPARYVRFALATECYDPICFDLNRFKNGDCPVVRIGHESILMHDKIGAYATMFSTFRDLIVAVINSVG